MTEPTQSHAASERDECEACGNPEGVLCADCAEVEREEDIERAERLAEEDRFSMASDTSSAAYRPERLVYVPGLPDWPVDIAVTGSVWREGEPTPFLIKPNNDVAALVIRAVNEHEERVYGDD